jgi:hypothetical protein
MRGAARPGSYQNQWKGMAISKPKPRRNKSNTIPKVNKTIPAEIPIIPVTLITWPMAIFLSAISIFYRRAPTGGMLLNPSGPWSGLSHLERIAA